MQKKKKKSFRIFNQLCKITPGGVNSPFRSFAEVGARTLLFSHGKGSKIWDHDGQEYIDYLGAWGPAVLGHAHPQITKAAKEAVSSSPVLGLSTRKELETAKLVQNAFPSMEMIRFVNSGAEAVECAIRLARGATRRPKIIRFEGGYHGHGDSVLWTYGPEEGRSAIECGVPPGLARETLFTPFNDFDLLSKVFASHGKEIAALLVEPVAGSMGVILPEPGFLQFCRKITSQHGSLLIFDEVLTGFRIAFGGAQERYKVKADITCLGKILGGGLPAGAYGGKRELMKLLAPLGPVYQAGTFSGNPVTMSSGAAVLKFLKNPRIYAALEKKTELLLSGFHEIAQKKGIPIQTPHAGSMFALIFSENQITNYRESLKMDAKRYSRFFKEMLKQGILFPPSATDAAVLSLAHTNKDIQLTLKAFSSIIEKL